MNVYLEGGPFSGETIQATPDTDEVVWYTWPGTSVLTTGTTEFIHFERDGTGIGDSRYRRTDRVTPTGMLIFTFVAEVVAVPQSWRDRPGLL